MPKVTDILTGILTEQGKRTISASDSIRRILEEVRRQVLVELISVPQVDSSITGFSAYTLRQTLDSIDVHLATFEVEAKKVVGQGLAESWAAGANMLPEMVNAAGISIGNFQISRSLLDVIDPWLEKMKEFSWGRIEGLRVDAALKIKGELTLGLLGQKTPYEVAQAIAVNLPKNLPQVNGKTVFKNIEERAVVITQTEMGRAFSMASQKSMEEASDTLPEVQKMWLHAGHPQRARIYHLNLNGSIMPVKEPFLVGSISMMYPRDPKAPVSEVIRCGCMHVAYMPSLGTKEEYLKSWEKAQKAANAKK